MRILDRYIGRQVLLGTLYAILILSLVLVLGNLFREVRPLLVEQQAPPGLVLKVVLNILPYSLMFTIPWGFLSAVLLVFGRLSSDREITALRVSGQSLLRLAMPVFVLGAAFSGLSLWLNLNVVPNAKSTVNQLLFEQATNDPDSLLKPGVVQGNLGSSARIKALIEGKEDGWVTGFHLFQLPGEDDPDGEVKYIYAARASLAVDLEKNQMRGKLSNAYFESTAADGQVEMAFAGNAEPLLIDLREPRGQRARSSAMTNTQILDYLETATDLSEERRVNFRAEITKRYSFSMACLAFAFVAVPLGLKSRRRESSSGLVLSLLIGAGYFLFTVLADEFETDRSAAFALWLPNVLCVALGVFLFRRARFK